MGQSVGWGRGEEGGEGRGEVGPQGFQICPRHITMTGSLGPGAR